MKLSRANKVALTVAVIGALGAIIAALVAGSSGGTSITQTGNGSICVNNSRCTQGG